MINLKKIKTAIVAAADSIPGYTTLSSRDTDTAANYGGGDFGTWGNDQLRVFGTKGMVETVDGFRRQRLYLARNKQGDQVSSETADSKGDEFTLPFPDDLVLPTYIYHYANYLLDGTPMLRSFEEEMAMTQAMITLHEASVRGERVVVPYPDR